jgi:hypothetical protein
MARSLAIEEEAGTFHHEVHPHNGYYAGDFSTTRTPVLDHGVLVSSHLRVVADAQTGTRAAAAVPASWPQAA